MRLAGTRMKHHPTREGLTIDTKAGPVWNGTVRFNEKALQDVLHWSKPRMIFWNAHGDLFHDSVPDEWIDRCFAVMALTPQHKHQVLTKRSKRMRAYMQFNTRRMLSVAGFVGSIAGKGGMPLRAGDDAAKRVSEWPLPNVWLGVSVEDQTRADERIPDLLATPAAVRWISAEPLLGPVDLRALPMFVGGHGLVNALRGTFRLRGHPEIAEAMTSKIDWVVAGGESGPNARPMHPDWARSLRDQCAAAGVAFLHKQNGEFAPGEIAGEYLDPEKPAKGLSLFDGRWDECWSEVDGHCDDEPDVYRVGKKRAGRLLDGVQHDGYPG